MKLDLDEIERKAHPIVEWDEKLELAIKTAPSGRTPEAAA